MNSRSYFSCKPTSTIYRYVRDKSSVNYLITEVFHYQVLLMRNNIASPRKPLVNLCFYLRKHNFISATNLMCTGIDKNAHNTT